MIVFMTMPIDLSKLSLNVAKMEERNPECALSSNTGRNQNQKKKKKDCDTYSP